MKPIIRVQDLGKRYEIGTRSTANANLRETLVGVVRAPFRRLRRNGHAPQTFWALKGVNFDVQPGETLGIIGKNGAGKSTLLKILSQITEPTTGRVELYGRLGSLLEVGTGFHPELTGRENVFLNGSILGISRKEIERKFDEIVAFSEIEKFIDTPVKYYSSGMYVRLAFAVAAHLEPDILVLDEVLAVGDATFQAKCLGKMSDVAREGRTVVFISHNMHAVRSLCTRSILLDEGRVLENGTTESVISRYLLESTGAAASSSLHQTWGDIQTAPGNDKIRLHKVQLIPDTNDLLINMDTPMQIEIDYWNMLPNTKLFLDLCLYSLDGSPVFDSMTAHEGDSERKQPLRGLFRSTCWIPGNLLNEGDYRMRIAFIDDAARILYDHTEALVFSVGDSRSRDIPWYGRFIGFVHPKLEWKTQLLQLEDEHMTTSIAG